MFDGLLTNVTAGGVFGLSVVMFIGSLVAMPILVACAIGLVYGWVTVTVRVWYEGKVTPKDAEAAESRQPRRHGIGTLKRG